ncbi:hypothetical protein [Mycobacterium xenopi]|uniref:hypothetical protein n=2 Tax=Mycobacterium xenopi TaxID=1789 RepID=UPI00044DD774|nr:hypothetical protein [Mycobacterium xenopi]EUA18500.1 papain cysteine protease family protein [Mycobacterium xenopi 3993]SPX78065.1 Uncharacterised protein [Mycobacterium xenopi]
MYRLGRHVEHDPRSRNFPAPTAPKQVSVLWGHHGPILDQGQIGSCTGNALADCINTDYFAACRPNGYLTENDALELYKLATRLDNVPGTYPPDDTGSSGLAVCKAGKQLGYLSSYRHAFGFDHFCAALQIQPVIVGTDWTADMFDPDSKGFVKPTGQVEGGHEYLALGIDYTAEVLTFLNSWSDGWGDKGRFYMTFADFEKLLAAQGDVCAPVAAVAPQPSPPLAGQAISGTFTGTLTGTFLPETA